MNVPAVVSLILAMTAGFAIELHRRGLVERRPIRYLLCTASVFAAWGVVVAGGTRVLIGAAMYAGLLLVAVCGLLIAVGPDLLDTCLTRRRRRSLRGWWFRYRHRI